MLALISLLAGLAQAQSPGQSAIQVKEPWVRGTVAQQKATGAFMQLSAPQDMRLIEARSPVAGVVQLLVTVGDQVKVGQPLARIAANIEGVQS